MARKILIVDDEPLIVKGLKYSLEQDNYETDSASAAFQKAGNMRGFRSACFWAGSCSVC